MPIKSKWVMGASINYEGCSTAVAIVCLTAKLFGYLLTSATRMQNSVCSSTFATLLPNICAKELLVRFYDNHFGLVHCNGGEYLGFRLQCYRLAYPNFGWGSLFLASETDFLTVMARRCTFFVLGPQWLVHLYIHHILKYVLVGWSPRRVGWNNQSLEEHLSRVVKRHWSWLSRRCFRFTVSAIVPLVWTLRLFASCTFSFMVVSSYSTYVVVGSPFGWNWRPPLYPTQLHSVVWIFLWIRCWLKSCNSIWPLKRWDLGLTCRKSVPMDCKAVQER